MAVSAFQTMYRNEIIAGFDKTVSVLRDTVTTEYMDKGGSAVFLVSDTAGEDAVTRGLNGLIPFDPLTLTQNTATLVEWHKGVSVSDFNIFASQGELRKPMQEKTMAAINRKIDNDIITVLDTATNDTGAATTASINLVSYAQVILGNNLVPNDGNLTLLVTQAFLGYLVQTKEFASADYVSARPYGAEGPPLFGDKRMVYKWMGMTVIVDPTLTGVGTATEKCYLYHKNAIGHAIRKNAIDAVVGYNEEQGYSFSRTTAYMGTKLLQNSGIVQILHNGAGFAAQ